MADQELRINISAGGTAKVVGDLKAIADAAERMAKKINKGGGDVDISKPFSKLQGAVKNFSASVQQAGAQAAKAAAKPLPQLAKHQSSLALILGTWKQMGAQTQATAAQQNHALQSVLATAKKVAAATGRGLRVGGMALASPGVEHSALLGVSTAGRVSHGVSRVSERGFEVVRRSAERVFHTVRELARIAFAEVLAIGRGAFHLLFAAGETAFHAIRNGFLLAGIGATALLVAVHKSADALDDLGKNATALGYTTQQMSGLRFAATSFGIEAENLRVGLGMMSQQSTLAFEQMQKAGVKSLGQVTQGLENGGRALQRLGVQLTDANGQMVSSQSLLEQIADGLSKMADGPQKIGLAGQLFGQEMASRFLPLLNQGKAGLQEFYAQAEKFGAIYSPEQIAAARAYKAAVAGLGAAFVALRNHLSVHLLPVVTQVATAMGNWIGQHGKDFDELVTRKWYKFESVVRDIQSLWRTPGFSITATWLEPIRPVFAFVKAWLKETEKTLRGSHSAWDDVFTSIKNGAAFAARTLYTLAQAAPYLLALAMAGAKLGAVLTDVLLPAFTALAVNGIATVTSLLALFSGSGAVAEPWVRANAAALVRFRDVFWSMVIRVKAGMIDLSKYMMGIGGTGTGAAVDKIKEALFEIETALTKGVNASDKKGGYIDYLAQLHDWAVKAKDAIVALFNAFSDALTKARPESDKGMSGYQVFAYNMIAFFRGVKDAISFVGSAFEKLNRWLGPVFGYFGTSLGEVLGFMAVLGRFAPILAPLAEMSTRIAFSLTRGLIACVPAIVEAVMGLAAAVVGAIGAVPLAIGAAIVLAIVAAFTVDKWWPYLDKFMKSITDYFLGDGAWQKIKDGIAAVWDGLESVLLYPFKKLYEYVIGPLAGALKGTLGWLAKKGDAGGRMIQAVTGQAQTFGLSKADAEQARATWTQQQEDKKNAPPMDLTDAGAQFADGGAVRGPGTGTSDSILSWLSNGEYVLPASAVSQLGTGFLEGLRRGGSAFLGAWAAGAGAVSRFAEGGMVGGGAGFAGGLAAASAGAGSAPGSGLGGAPVNLIVGGKVIGGITATGSAVGQMQRSLTRASTLRPHALPRWA